MGGNHVRYRGLSIGFGILCLLIVITLVVWGCTSPSLSSATDKFEPTYFHTGWSQQVGDEWIPLEHIHDFQAEGVESLVFTCTLPELREGQVLLFYSKNKEVTCYVDHRLIHSFTMQEGFEALQTPGSAWIQVDLDGDMSGKTLTLVFHSPRGQYNTLCDIYFIASEFVETVRLTNIWGTVAAVTLVFLLMVIVLAAGFVWSHPRRKRYFFAIALYFLVVILWMLGELNFYDIFFSRPIISYLITESIRRMIPLALLYLAKNSTNQYWHPHTINVLAGLAVFNLLVPLLLQFTVGVALIELEGLHYFILAVIAVVLSLIMVEKMVYFKRLEYEEYPFLAVPILLVGSAIDVVMYSIWNMADPFDEVWTAVGCVAFSFVTFVVITRINSRMVQDKMEVERSYQVLENTTLVQQLEVHFIFNTLNTISALCKTDPEEADRAVKAFAGYLRTYLHLISEHENISMEQELDLVENYLTIQQMRFGDRLNFAFDIGFADFEVPPFIVHTFVENSVKHGIRGQRRGGMVTISTARKANTVQVTIVDTGAGFDTNCAVGASSVGLRNAKRRLEIMRHGTVSIESAVGVGTTVTLTLPMD